MRVGNVSLGLPKPRGAVLGLLLATFLVWLTLALGINWGGASSDVVTPLLGSSALVLHGEVWRLFTAAFVHTWSGDEAVGHVLTTLVIVYFFGPALQDRWGWKRFLMFSLGAAVFGYVCQTLVGTLVPKLDQRVWWGGLGMADALVIAWALQADPGQRVLLFFVLPVTPTMIIGFTLLLNVLKVVAMGAHFEGLVTPFGGMLAGYLLCDRSPLRRYWLKLRLQRLQSQATSLRRSPVKARAGGPSLRVIPGGGDDKPKDKRYLN